jgi:hypothetical protein
MAWLFAESFDHYSTADITSKWTQHVVQDGGVISAGNGGRGTQSYRTSGSSNGHFSSSLHKTVNTTSAVAIFGFRMRSNVSFTGYRNSTNSEAYGSDGSCVACVRYLGTTQIWIQLTTTGALSVYRGSTLLATSSNTLQQSVQAYIEFMTTLGTGTAGAWELRVNETTWISGSGTNTANQGTARWDEFRLGPYGNITAGSQSVDYDDLYLADGDGSNWNTFMGDMCIDAVYPDSNGSHSDFTRSTGANQYATVDEALANGDTDYNSTAVVNNIDTLGFAAVPRANAAIKGVQVVAQVKRLDSGPAGHRAVTRIGGVDYMGTEVKVGSSYTFQMERWAKKPSDNTDWTDSDVNAAEFGYQKST